MVHINQDVAYDRFILTTGGGVLFTWTIYANAFRVADRIVKELGGSRYKRRSLIPNATPGRYDDYFHRSVACQKGIIA
jgi:hypothetical protein